MESAGDRWYSQTMALPGTLERERDEWRAMAFHLLRVHAVEGCVDCEAARKTAQDIPVESSVKTRVGRSKQASIVWDATP